MFALRANRAVAAFCALLASGAAFAQDVTVPEVQTGQGVSQSGTQTRAAALQLPIIAFSHDKVLAKSVLGRAVEQRFEAMRLELSDENESVAASLEQEEKELSDLKASLSKEEFATRADAFDLKVTGIRAVQKEKLDAIQSVYDQGIRTFESNLVKVLEEIAIELNALAVFELQQLYLRSRSIDVTDEVIRRLDARAAGPDPESLGQSSPESADTSGDEAKP